MSLLCLVIVSCTSQPEIIATTPTNIFTPSAISTAQPTLTEMPQPTWTPEITATPITFNPDSQDIDEIIHDQYKVTWCEINILIQKTAEGDKPEFLDFTNQVDFAQLWILEIADSTNNKYRAYLVEEPDQECGENCFRSRIYSQNLSTGQVYRINWSGYMPWRITFRMTWIGDTILVFMQSVSPSRAELVGIDVEKQNYVYHSVYSDPCE